MSKALKTGLCLFVLTLIFAGCENPASDDGAEPGGIKSGQELQTALSDPAITDVVIGASFVSNVSTRITGDKTISIPPGYQVMIAALQVEADLTLTNGGNPPSAGGNLASAGILIIGSGFLVTEDASFSVTGAAELAFGPEVAAGNAWIDGELSAAAAASIYRMQQGDIAEGLAFGGEGTIKRGDGAAVAANTVTVEATVILGNPVTETSNAEEVENILTAPGNVTLGEDPGEPGKLTVSWGEVSGAASYEVYHSTSDDTGEATKYSPDVTGTSVVLDLAVDSTYYVWVKTKIGTWTSAFSEPGELLLPEYSIQLSEGARVLNDEDTVVIDSRASGYSSAPSKTITIQNTGSGPTGPLTVELSGTDAANFTLSPGTVPSIAVEGNATFTVSPVSGLDEGTYTATVTVTGGHELDGSFKVSFTVSDDLIAGSVTIVYEDGFPADPELSYSDGITPNEAGEIPLTWSESVTISTGTTYYKTIYVDGTPSTTLEQTESDYVFRPGAEGEGCLRLVPGPHTVTVFFSESEGGTFIASAELKFRISLTETE
jgi:hypothetical protein